MTTQDPTATLMSDKQLKELKQRSVNDADQGLFEEYERNLALKQRFDNVRYEKRNKIINWIVGLIFLYIMLTGFISSYELIILGELPNLFGWFAMLITSYTALLMFKWISYYYSVEAEADEAEE